MSGASVPLPNRGAAASVCVPDWNRAVYRMLASCFVTFVSEWVRAKVSTCKVQKYALRIHV